MNLSRQVVQSGELNDNSWMLVHNDSYTGMEATAAIQPYPAYVGVALPTILRTYWYGGTNGTRIPTIDFFYEKHQYNASSPLINISLVNFATSTNISNFCLDIANETVNYTQCNLNAGHIVYSDTSYVPEGHCNLTIWKQNVAYNLTTATLDNSTLTNVSAYAWPYQNFNASNATGGAALSEFNITFVNNATLGSFFGNTTNGSIQIELVNFSDNNYGLYDLYASAPNFPSAHIQYNFTSSSLYYIDCVFQPLPEIVACTGSEPIILNFTYFNETSLEPINQTQEITITIWDASREASANYSFNLSSPSENHTLCINPANASNYYIDTFQTYGLPNGTTNERNYFMYNAPMGNTTEFIQLYNLPSSKTYLVRVWVRDNAGVGTGNVFVSFMRFYPASNQYRTVAMAKTDSQGYSNAYLAINDPHYRIIVYSGSTVLQSFEPQKVSCDVSVYSVCDLTLQIEREGGISWEVNNNFAHNCQYVNGSTDYVICTYTDLTGKMNKVSLSCFRQGLLAESSICAESNTSSSGVLVCDLTNETGQYICYLNVKFGTNSSYWLAETLGVGYTNPPIFGVDGLMVSIMLLMVMAAAGVWSVPVSIAFGLFGLIAAVYMGSIVLGATALSGIVIVGVVVAYLSRKSYG